MLVLLIRHSLAVPPGSMADFDRTLTEAGCERFQKMSDWLVDQNIKIDQVVHSPRVRAKQTAEILCNTAGVKEACRFELPMLGEEYTSERLAEELRKRTGETIAVVGHNPSISQAASEFINGGSLVFVEGTVAAIGFSGSLRVGQGLLTWMMNPTLLTGEMM